jgi:hypothetical protein
MAKSKVLVCRHIMAWAKFHCASISGHKQCFSMPAYQGISKSFQYASISGHKQNFSMPAYRGIDLNPPITVYFGSPTYQGIYQ